MSLVVSNKRRNRNLLPTLVNDFFDSDNIIPNLFGEDFMNWNVSKLPSINIRENDKEYAIDVAAPGLDKKDFKIEIDNDMLTIRTEKEEEVKEDKENYRRREFSYNYFSRSFRLPENAVAEKIDARYENGILQLIIPKKEGGNIKPKKEITIS